MKIVQHQFIVACFFLLFVASTTAFSIVETSRQTTTTQLHLHPSQAEELESCAYDLMKDAMEQQAMMESSCATAVTNEHVTTTRKGGPLKWCRRHLWPFGRAGGTATTATATTSTTMDSTKLRP
mmetsp:Transcript_3688/g.10423  ORF Transcript_3688/g.10423 Transcript_3688/m.10423 type:complete len:124 (-) Transcript_3688:234-605(-)|eukprot:CAMPEP_0119558700 /NCGR_PEP_ID=MMETSP1352-20130426/11040_1 /TAXON_ID=265584 /ORGANISM="Stauroneis constricta, Strain CCMP1120" /LENGTH=123 /DNA_ID=CAMNT_0007606127 /DNA_START=24 /DNA_END=395 /DNA_ORIENTATION=+